MNLHDYNADTLRASDADFQRRGRVAHSATSSARRRGVDPAPEFIRDPAPEFCSHVAALRQQPDGTWSEERSRIT